MFSTGLLQNQNRQQFAIKTLEKLTARTEAKWRFSRTKCKWLQAGQGAKWELSQQPNAIPKQCQIISAPPVIIVSPLTPALSEVNHGCVVSREMKSTLHTFVNALGCRGRRRERTGPKLFNCSFCSKLRIIDNFYTYTVECSTCSTISVPLRTFSDLLV